MGFGPQDWDLGLEAGIWASRLRYVPGGWGEGGCGGGEIVAKALDGQRCPLPLCECMLV